MSQVMQDFVLQLHDFIAFIQMNMLVTSVNDMKQSRTPHIVIQIYPGSSKYVTCMPIHPFKKTYQYQIWQGFHMYGRFQVYIYFSEWNPKLFMSPSSRA